MKQKTYEVQPPKKKKNVIKVEFDITKVPSPIHKFCVLNTKSVRFDDRRKRKPKHKNKDIDW
jgi:hypothetical protein